ncbi:DUF397 domain-containing protein [Streptomyces camelliae]|uniref:DUF397 domain-containing protein n=1 Tax=Streptomyces camelliae TaxID=3004093 RepID=A0ABY7P5N7_9ACTN|nr:DUF397 domain-containing protein [Streptomyces sp. HUAS 2-6]WBO64834.1 DUF397 domain-containing protein [Streptomyces sp. HUAS 2-6]
MCSRPALGSRPIHVRDSKNPSGPELNLTAPAWTAFLADVSVGRPGA